MRKIIAITTLSFFSLFLKNEKAICKSSCQSTSKSSCNTTVTHPEINADTNTNTDAPHNGLKQYYGFFFKI